MKIFPGFSDSIASMLADPPRCPYCESSSRIGGGLCVGCLLRVGLEPDDDFGVETLASALAEITLPDKNWHLGNYEILEEIGRGGMGVIYRARQRHSGRVVAVKRILSYHSDSRETLARFRREAQAAASLDHPSILPIYEVSESEDGLPFFSMKFAPGGSLREVGPALKNEPRQCVALIAKIARAVQFAHERGILHRDLKPGNILLDSRCEPLVSDFGLAKWLDTTSDLTRTLTIFGTPGYIAPEQANGLGAQLKPSADVYSLGAILFELLAGRPPFLGSHALSVIHQASESPAPKLRSLSKPADRDLETICARCLEREPSARYHSAHDLAEDLERWLEGRPIIARPVLPSVRLWRCSRRNPVLAVLVAMIIIVSGFGLAAMIARSRLSSIVQRTELERHSIALKPFEDLADLSTSSNISQLVTQEFTIALTRANGIQVKPTVGKTAELVDPWRTEDWKKIGETAGARMVLSGSVRQREGRRRVAIHLIETATGSVLSTWLQDAESFSVIAKTSVTTIANGLDDGKDLPASSGQLSITSDGNAVGETKSSMARSYYERGKEFFLRYNLPDLDRALDSFRKALAIDSDYAKAHAMLATTCQLRSIIDPGGPWLDEADIAASTALRIAPMLPEAHDASAGNLLYRGKIRASLDGYLTAYELDPANGRAAARLGYAYHLLGRPDLSILWYRKATRRETRPVYADNIGDAWTDLQDYDKAEEAYRMAAIFRPDLPAGDLGLSRVAMLRGDYNAARAECRETRVKYQGNPQPLMMAAQIEFFSRDFDTAEKFYREASAADHAGGVAYYGAVRFLSAMGFARQHSGAEEEGKALLEEAVALDKEELSAAPDNPSRLYSLAADYAALGNREAAITTLERAAEAGWIDCCSMSLDPRFDSILSEPRFTNALENMSARVNSFHSLLLTEN